MYDPEAVCFFEDIANLRSDVDCMCEGKSSLAMQCLRKSFAFDEFHHDEMTTVRKDSRVEDHRGVWMAQPGHRARFAQESIGDVGIARKLTPDDLDCDGAFQTKVGGEVNSAHAACPD